MTTEPLVRWDWLGAHLGPIADRVGQHLQLTVIAVAIGFTISFLLAALSIRRRKLYPIVVVLSTAIYTIPSFAVFVVLIVVWGPSVLSAEVPLVMYTVVLFVPNIVTGFDTVPLEVIDSADGMGFTPWQRWWQVELPLALPLVVASVRLATVSTIGLVTVTAVLGDTLGGLGYYILDGYQRNFTTEILVGGLLSIVLAVLADLALVLLQRALTPWATAREAAR